MGNYWLYIIMVLWAISVVWFIREVVWKVRRIRYEAYLRRLSNKQLSDLYTERWLSLNADLLKNRRRSMQYVAIIGELIRRNMYTGKIVH